MTSRRDKIKGALADRKLRFWLCKKSLFLFGLYYFGNYFFRPAAPFHRVMAKDAEFSACKYLVWIMFRGSAKTVWARIKVLHLICYGLKRNIAWISHDLKKSAKQVMAIANELKANKKIVRDFGHLFFENPFEKKLKSKLKTFSEFITSNDVYVKAMSTQVSTRGDVIAEFRPDFYVVDDIENMRTARSIQTTQGNIEFLGELLGGLNVDCELMILANRIARNGVVSWIERHFEDNVRAIIHEVKLLREDGSITWPQKFVQTAKEAARINLKIADKKRHVSSVDELKADLGSIGFEREMQNNPSSAAGSPVLFEWIKRAPLPDIATLDLKGAVDPAISEKQTADFFSLCVCGGHRETGKIYVMRSYKTRCGITEQVNLIVNFHGLFPKAKWRIETVAYQKALLQLLSDQKKNGVYIAVEEFKPDIDKLRRLLAIVPFIERGDVVFCEGREIDELIASLCAFPFADHDDDVDSMISLIESFVHTKKSPSLLVK